MPNSANALPMISPKQQEGESYETLAVQFLQREGLGLVAQNWLKPKVGELDLVMLEQGKLWDTLVFVEVRKRKPSGFGDAMLSVTPAKQRKIIKAARYFLQAYPQYAQMDCRFDVIAFDVNDGMSGADEQILPEWVQGAFYAQF